MKRLGQVMIIGLLALLCLGIGFWFLGQDETLAPAPDLSLEPVSAVEDANNMHPLLPTSADRKEQSDAALVAQFITATERPVYQCPFTVSEPISESASCELGVFRQVAGLTLAEAQAAADRGNIADWTTGVRAVLRFAHALQAGQGGQVEQLVSYALFMLAYDALLEEILKLTPAEQTVLADIVLATAPDQTVLPQVVQVEYARTTELLRQVTSSGVPGDGAEVTPGYRWQPNRTQNALTAFAAAQTSQVTVPCAVTDDPQIAALERLSDRPLSLGSLLLPNIVGKHVLQVSFGSVAGLRDSYCDVEELYAQVRSALEVE